MDANFELIEACKKGSKSAFENVYKLYSQAMFSVSLRVTNNREESEDILQESFLSAFQNIQQYRGEASFGSWLKRIVINKSIDVVKKRRLKFTSINDIDLVEDNTSEEENENDYSIETINKAVQQLPDGFRTVLTLFLFEDYSHKEIAEMLGISENTSKTQYLRARKKLSGLLTEGVSLK